MKMQTILIFLVLAMLRSLVVAQDGPPPHARQGPNAAARADDLAALEYFLSMSDAELDRLQAAITRVRTMTPEARASFRQRMLEYRALPDEQRNVIRQGWGWQDPADRDDWRTMMQSKSESERSAIQAELQSLLPEERTDRRLELLTEWRKARPSTAP